MRCMVVPGAVEVRRRRKTCYAARRCQISWTTYRRRQICWSRRHIFSRNQLIAFEADELYKIMLKCVKVVRYKLKPRRSMCTAVPNVLAAPPDLLAVRKYRHAGALPIFAVKWSACQTVTGTTRISARNWNHSLHHQLTCVSRARSTTRKIRKNAIQQHTLTRLFYCLALATWQASCFTACL